MPLGHKDYVRKLADRLSAVRNGIFSAIYGKGCATWRYSLPRFIGVGLRHMKAYLLGACLQFFFTFYSILFSDGRQSFFTQ
jgi:hypothetical protein